MKCKRTAAMHACVLSTNFIKSIWCHWLCVVEWLRLKLQGAVLLQPLTTEQIDAYLNTAGPTLATVRSTLQHDTELQELAHSPLLLSIMALAYQDITPTELSLTAAIPTRRQHLFNAYIGRMFIRREVKPIYSFLHTIRWLQWLASQLVQ